MLATCAGAGAFSFATQAAWAAAPLPLRLEWSAPLECPTGEQVERDLARITRPRPGRSLLALHARAILTREPNGYHLALALERNGELREAHFDSQSCAPLRKAASLVLALAFGDGIELRDEPAESAEQSEASDGNEPVALPPIAPARRRDAEADPTRRERGARPLRLVPWAGAAVSSGFIGSSALGVDVGLGVGGRFWGLFVRGGALPPSTAATREGVSAQLSAMTGALGACASHSFAVLRLDGCLAFEGGVVRAHSNGALRDGSVLAPWYALGPALSTLLPLTHPFSLRAELALLVALEGGRYDVEPLGTLYATSQLVPRGSLALAFEL